MKPIITVSLHNTLLVTPLLKTVYFSQDGQHHFRVFECNKKLYARLREIPEKTSTGIVTKKFIEAPILDAYENEDARFVIAETLTREQVLSMTPIQDTVKTGLSKADVYAALEISPEELSAFLKKSRKN